MQTNNKLREALELCDRIIQDGTIVCACDIVDEARTVVRAALAAPPRNCDVGTPEEQTKRFKDLCERHGECMSWDCTCPIVFTTGICELVWAQLPYEEGGEK